MALIRPEGFIVPECVLEIASVITKKDLIILLKILSGKKLRHTTSKKLQSLGIVDEKGKIIWEKQGSEITIIKPQNNHYKDAVNATPDIDSLFSTLSDGSKTLWRYHAGWMRDKKWPITDNVKLNWVNKMIELSSKPNFKNAVAKCNVSKIGSPKIVEDMINKMNTKSEGNEW